VVAGDFAEEAEAVSQLPRGDSVRLAYVTPSHQFPLGGVLSLARRGELLQWADQSGALIVEDDYDSEFWYDGSPVEAIQGLDRAGRVIYIGTFSKVLLRYDAFTSARLISSERGRCPIQ
jgi:GntR family transcriptional regulator/MocR family aminotransferase